MVNQNILLVDDDAGSIQIMGRILGGLGQLRFATNGEDALRLAREAVPDLMLLDAEMPGMSGFQVLEAFKAEPKLADVPVIFVTCHSDAAFEVAGFELGAADFIAKPISAPLVLARVKAQLRVKRVDDELRAIATNDMLTRVANRRSFDESLDREWRRTRLSGEPLSLLMIEVDHFKLFNERYGAQAGDACLRSLAQTLSGACRRPADRVARYGDEEFAVLLPQTPRNGAERVAHGVLDAVEALGIPHEASPTARHVTVSVGISSYDNDSGCWLPPSGNSRPEFDLPSRYTPVDLVHAASKALHTAKSAGRAQSQLLDITDVDTPHLARDVALSFHEHNSAKLV